MAITNDILAMTVKLDRKQAILPKQRPPGQTQIMASDRPLLSMPSAITF